mgnify:CR=1 FL=1
MLIKITFPSHGYGYDFFCFNLMSLRRTIEQIFILHNMVKQSIERRSLVYLNFVDFAKAFDSLERLLLWYMLGNYGSHVKQYLPHGVSMKEVNSWNCQKVFSAKTRSWHLA